MILVLFILVAVEFMLIMILAWRLGEVEERLDRVVQHIWRSRIPR